MNLLIIILLLFFKVFVKCALAFKINTNTVYLSSSQWQSIHSLLKNPKLTSEMRNKINTIIYNHYETYALVKAYEFKTFHKYKCQNIKLDELKLYSKVGLIKAVKKYNGYSYFVNYADKYIMGELYKGLTDLYPLSSIPKIDRRKGIQHRGSHLMKEHPTTFIRYENYWLFDKYNLLNGNDVCHIDKIIESDNTRALLEFIHRSLDPFSKQVFFYKYDTNFNVMRTNKQVADLLCCSEETIRIALIEIKNRLKREQ
jgi:DNA-directed RNA polymerase specialized sigma subunit